ncbi:MAG: alpha/beta hydrolase, partial [Candidatus Nanosynbacter sp.]|nr:alpha/beta hydrolase [Candidatus Nanosynbacter sp.]
ARVIAIDMLGFGNSPKPDWKTYNVHDQAASIAATLRREFINHVDVVIGHSMGSLAAVELAKQYPKLSKSLILCSPPIYYPRVDEKIHHPEKILRTLYEFFNSHPRSSKRFLQFADRHNIWPDAGFKVDEVTSESFLIALNTAIINQTTMSDIAELTLPIAILSGKLDPLIVERNLKKLAKDHNNITHTSMATQRHEITDKCAKKLSGVMKDYLAGEYSLKTSHSTAKSKRGNL